MYTVLCQLHSHSSLNRIAALTRKPPTKSFVKGYRFKNIAFFPKDVSVVHCQSQGLIFLVDMLKLNYAITIKFSTTSILLRLKMASEYLSIVNEQEVCEHKCPNV